MIGWGWFYLSTVLDDFFRYIVAWKLCTNMRAEDVTATLDLALQASGLVRRREVPAAAATFQKSISAICRSTTDTTKRENGLRWR